MVSSLATILNQPDFKTHVKTRHFTYINIITIYMGTMSYKSGANFKFQPILHLLRFNK